MDFEPKTIAEQKKCCAKFETIFFSTPAESKVGAAANIAEGIYPLNGLRHPPSHGTSGWYLWAGTELSNAPDFFIPLHAGHLLEWCPEILKYLGLPPGWRFLIAEGYEDVWFDQSLLAPEIK